MFGDGRASHVQVSASEDSNEALKKLASSPSLVPSSAAWSIPHPPNTNPLRGRMDTAFRQSSLRKVNGEGVASPSEMSKARPASAKVTELNGSLASENGYPHSDPQSSVWGEHRTSGMVVGLNGRCSGTAGSFYKAAGATLPTADSADVRERKSSEARKLSERSPPSLSPRQLDSVGTRTTNSSQTGSHFLVSSSSSSVAPLDVKPIPGASGPLSFTPHFSSTQIEAGGVYFGMSSRSSNTPQWTSVYVADSDASLNVTTDAKPVVTRTPLSRMKYGEESDLHGLRRRRTSNSELDPHTAVSSPKIVSSLGVHRTSNRGPRSATKRGSEDELWSLPMVLNGGPDSIDKTFPEERATPSTWFTSKGTCSTLSELSTITGRSTKESRKGTAQGFLLSGFNKLAEVSSQVSRSFSLHHGNNFTGSVSSHVTVEEQQSSRVLAEGGEEKENADMTNASSSGSWQATRCEEMGFVPWKSARPTLEQVSSPVQPNARGDGPLGNYQHATRTSLSFGSRRFFSASTGLSRNPLEGAVRPIQDPPPPPNEVPNETGGEPRGNASIFSNTETRADGTDRSCRSYTGSSNGNKGDLHHMTPKEMLDDGKFRVHAIVPALLNVWVLVSVFTLIAFLPIYITGNQSLRDAIRGQSVVTAEGVAGCVYEALSVLPEVVNLVSATWMLNHTVQAFTWDETFMEQAMTQMCNLLNRSAYGQQILFLQISSPTSGFGSYCSAQYKLTADENALGESGKTLSDVDFNVDTELVGSFRSNNKSTLRYIIDKDTLTYTSASQPYYPVNSMTEAEYTVDFGGENNPYHEIALKWYEAYKLGKSFSTMWSTNIMWTISGNTSMLSYTYPFIDFNGNLAQVTGAIQPSGLERIIENINLSAGVAMVMNPTSGLVLGNTWGSALSIVIDSWNESYADDVPKSNSRSADETTNALMRAAVKQLGGVAAIAAVPSTTTQWQQSMKYEGTEAFINARRVIAEDTGLDVVVIVVLLQSSFDESMKRGQISSIISVAIVGVIFVLLDLYLIYTLMQPFHIIIRGLRKAAVLSDRGVELPSSLSRLKELAEIQAYFSYLHSQLMLMKTFLPLGLMGEMVDSSDSMSSSSASHVEVDDAHAAATNSEEATEEWEATAVQIPSSVENVPLASNKSAPAQGKKKKRSNSKSSSSSSSDDDADKKKATPKEKDLKINEKALWEGINTFRRRHCTLMQVQLNVPSKITNFGKLVAMFMEAVVPVVLRFGGVIEVQRADSLYITFGAFTETPMHQTKAARCAIELIALANEAIRPLISIVLDVGECYVGTCGAANRNARVVYCPQGKMQVEINLISYALLAPIVLTPKMASMLDAQMMTFPVDAILFSNTGQCVILYELRGYYDGFLPSEQPRMRTLAKTLRVAFGHMLAGKYTDAMECLEDVQRQDIQAMRLHAMCAKMMEAHSPTAFSRSVREVIRAAEMSGSNAQHLASLAAISKPVFQARHAETNRQQQPLIGLNGKLQSTVGTSAGRFNNVSGAGTGFNGVVKLILPGSTTNAHDPNVSINHNASSERTVAATSALSRTTGAQSRSEQLKTRPTFVGDTHFEKREREKEANASNTGNSHSESEPLRRVGSKITRADTSEIPSTSFKSTGSALFEMFGEADNSSIHRDCGSMIDGSANSMATSGRPTLDADSITAYEDLHLVDPTGSDDKMSAWRTLKGELPMVFKDMQGTLWRRSENLLGTGSFSTVYRGMSMTGSLVALKCMALRSRDVDFERIEEEVNIFAQLEHENIVQYISCCTSSDFLTVIMELVPGGSLEGILTSFGRLTKMAARRFLRDILHGLVYLHSQNIVHCDIKPHNVLVGMDGTCKISDFGSSMFRQGNAVKTIEDVLEMRGTSSYMAPEVARGEVPTTKSDIFSLGVTVLHMVMGVLPWEYASVIADANAGAPRKSDSMKTKTNDEEDKEKIAAGFPLSPLISRGSECHVIHSKATSTDVGDTKVSRFSPSCFSGNREASMSVQQHPSDAATDTNPLTISPTATAAADQDENQQQSSPPPVVVAPPPEKIPINVLVRNPANLVSAIANGEVVPYVDPRFEDDVREFALACVNSVPAQRPTAQQLLEFLWML